jgi:hypothetical protein
MERTDARWFVLIVGAVGMLAMLTPAAAAAKPPVTGDVSCAMQGSIEFNPPLDYQKGRTGRPTPPPERDAKVTVTGTLTGCTGAQAGGNPKKPGPLHHGELIARGMMVDHSCGTLSLHGVTVSKVKVRWFNAGGALVGVTKGTTGTVIVSGLGEGLPSTWTGPPSQVFPPTVAPGFIDFAASLGSDPTSSVFPGEPSSMSARVDQTMDGDFAFRCSYETPPLSMGVGSFTFSGATYTVS